MKLNTNSNLWILVVIELVLFALVFLIRWIIKLYEAHKLKKAMNFLTQNMESKMKLAKELSEYMQSESEDDDNLNF